MTSARIIAIVPARSASGRLPSKVLMPIGQEPMLTRVIQRIQRMRTIDDFIVATSVSPHDDSIAQLCAAQGWHCFRGPEQDVLERTLRAAQAMKAADIVSIAADCPLFSWQQADRLVAHHVASGADCSHSLTEWGSGFPIGTGIEVLTLDALGMAWTYGLEQRHREDVGEYIHDQPDRFSIELQRAPKELDRPSYRLTVDTLDDLRLIRRLHERISPFDELVDLREAIALLDQEPELARTNTEPERKAG